MNKKKILFSQIIVTIVSIILGILLHFAYEWSNLNKFVAVFSAVNESTWEHLKLAFYPMIIVGIIQAFFIYKESNNYLEAKAVGIFTAISLIVIFFYAYTGIIGTNYAIINILIFVVSVIVGEYIAYRMMISKNESSFLSKLLSIIILIYLLVCFIIFTYNTPRINFFKDPVTGKYGLEARG